MLAHMRTLVKVGLALAAAAITAAVVVRAAAQPREPQPPPQNDGEKIEVRITGEMIRHSRLRDTLYFVQYGFSILAVGLVLVAGWSRRIRDAAERMVKNRFVASMIYIALFILVLNVLEFPLDYYSSYVVPHQFDLTDQSFGGWLGDELKGLAVGIVVSSLVGALALFGIRRMKRWWLALWIGSIPLIIFFVVIQPVVLDPIFNDFQPLKNERLRNELLELASRAGIEGGRVYQVDKSKQTKTMNAYVNGIGPTARIVMWDTLLAKMTEEEVLAVMGHEMGHYVMKHLWKGLAFGFGISLIVFFLTQRAYDWGLRRWGAKWGVREPGDPASTPWLVLTGVLVIPFFLSPVIAGYSRTMEHDSDIFALELTHLNEPMARAFVKLAEDSKRDPTPHPFIRFWLYTHPPINERIAFSLSYKPWEKGEPNRLWKETAQ
jgi:STE24 endopeptidase